MGTDQDRISTVDKITDYMGDASGTLVGSAVGAVIGGPAGAVAGSVAATAIDHIMSKIGSEIKKRAMGPLEEQRVGKVYTQAKNLISKKINEGEVPRDDDFFNKTCENRSASEELLEGVLSVAKNEYEERKTPYLARLYANILFHEEISRPSANYLLKLSEQITYRQIIILSILGDLELAHQAMPQVNLLKKESYHSVSGMENVAIAAEIFDLYRMSILGSHVAILDSAGINPSALTLVGYGANLFNLMELSHLEPDENLIELQSSVMAFLTGSK